ncbi:MAG TPA: hypothetical protein P5050_09435 [Bacteroidia bacterium]|nr:hypothetical protein [Bacteroidia bacterium]HRS59430.1 hypothetical protein [Bacteroidia bacterium]HRU68629.1 hypothetical protein [Bacteroidia bacterium]
MKRVLIFSVLVLSFITSPLLVTQLFSQPVPPPVATPIDGGLSFLAILGLGFIIRKKFHRNK